MRSVACFVPAASSQWPRPAGIATSSHFQSSMSSSTATPSRSLTAGVARGSTWRGFGRYKRQSHCQPRSPPRRPWRAGTAPDGSQIEAEIDPAGLMDGVRELSNWALGPPTDTLPIISHRQLAPSRRSVTPSPHFVGSHSGAVDGSAVHVEGAFRGRVEHSSVSFTYDRYGRLFPEVDSEAASKLDVVRRLGLGGREGKESHP